MIVHTLRNLHHSSKNRNLPLITIFQYAKATSKSETKHDEVAQAPKHMSEHV